MGFSTWLGRFRSHKRASSTTATSRRNPKAKELKKSGVSHKDFQKNTNLNSISKPRGHKEGRASFPTKIQYKVFTIPWLKSYLEERKEEEHGGRRGGGGAWLFLCFFVLSSAHHQGEGGTPFCQPASATYSRCLPFPFPASLHLKTKLPLRLE